MGSSPAILAFDTSAAHCAAALLRDGDIVSSHLELLRRGQAERLMPLIQQVLEEGGLDWPQLDAVATGIGPGNFTGIRISVATARGLGLALERPVLGVSSFEIMAAAPQAAGHDALLVSLEAPRGSVYLQHFRGGLPEGAPMQTDPAAPEIQTPEPGLHVLGHAAAGLGAALGTGWTAAALEDIAPRIARRAAWRLARGESPPPPAPLYVRAADAAPPSEAPPVIVDG